MSTSASPAPRERADRKRNRELIIRVARAAFARADEARQPVSMNEIAREAGIGAATLYRHFPTREDLADAVYATKLDEVTERARSGSRSQNGLTSLRAWVAEFASFMLAKPSMMDTVRGAWTSPAASTSPIGSKITAIMSGLLRDGAQDGTIRADVDAADLTIALLALLSATPPGNDGSRSTRLLDLLIDGLGATRIKTDH